jgi:hypothetical protein
MHTTVLHTVVCIKSGAPATYDRASVRSGRLAGGPSHVRVPDVPALTDSAFGRLLGALIRGVIGNAVAQAIQAPERPQLQHALATG